jgi:hypothetical protein
MVTCVSAANDCNVTKPTMASGRSARMIFSSQV